MKNDSAVKFFVSIIGLFVISKILIDLEEIFISLIIAYFILFLFEPLHRILKKRKVPISLILIIDLVIILSAGWVLSEILITQFSQFATQLPEYKIKLNESIRNLADSFGISNPSIRNFSIDQQLQQINLQSFAGGLFNSTVNMIASIALILFFYIFIITGHDKVFEVIKARYVQKKLMYYDFSDGNNDPDHFDTVHKEKSLQIESTLKNIIQQVQQYILTKFVISLFTGIVSGFVMLLFGVDFILIWVVFTVLLNFIPNIGSIIAVILPVLMAFIQFQSFTTTAFLAAILIIVQNIIGNLLEPKIMGDKLGLNPLVILISLLFWGYIWGIIGMFISVPLTAIIKIMLSNSDSDSMKFLSNLMSN